MFIPPYYFVSIDISNIFHFFFLSFSFSFSFLFFSSCTEDANRTYWNLSPLQCQQQAKTKIKKTRSSGLPLTTLYRSILSSLNLTLSLSFSHLIFFLFCILFPTALNNSLFYSYFLWFLSYLSFSILFILSFQCFCTNLLFHIFIYLIVNFINLIIICLFIYLFIYLFKSEDVAFTNLSNLYFQ